MVSQSRWVCRLIVRSAWSPSCPIPAAWQKWGREIITFVCCVCRALGPLGDTWDCWRPASCSAHTCMKWRVKWFCLSVLFIFEHGWQILIKFSIEILPWMLCGYFSLVSVGPVWILIYMELNSSFAWFYFFENKPLLRNVVRNKQYGHL